MTTPAVAVPRIEIKAVAQTRTGGGRRLRTRNQVLLQLACLAIGSTVLFPIVWIVGMSLDPRNIARPDTLIPPGANLDAYARVLARPTLNPVSFFQLALNSLTVAVIISVLSVGLGVLAAYSFSRMKFRGREFMMLLVLAVLMLPAVATIGPLYISMNRIAIGDFRLGGSLLGVALAVTALFGFIAGWTEFLLAQVFIVGDPSQWTLAVALNALVGQYAGSTPWSTFAAFAILFALPVMVVYLLLQRWIVSGLTVGGVKG